MQRVVSAVMWEGVTLFVVGLVLGICYGKRQCPCVAGPPVCPLRGPQLAGGHHSVSLRDGRSSLGCLLSGTTLLRSSSFETCSQLALSVFLLYCAGRLSDSCWAPPHNSDAAPPLQPAPYHHPLPRQQWLCKLQLISLGLAAPCSSTFRTATCKAGNALPSCWCTTLCLYFKIHVCCSPPAAAPAVAMTHSAH